MKVKWDYKFLCSMYVKILSGISECLCLDGCIKKRGEKRSIFSFLSSHSVRGYYGTFTE